VSPSGAACSLDRIIALWKGRAASELPLISLWGQRLIQFQIALLYFTTIWWKWFGTYWKDGTATWYPARLHEFDRFWVPSFMEQQPFIGITTYGTVVVELAMGTLVFYKPLRKYVLISAVCMHGYIEYRFNIPLFAFTVTSAYIAFYEGEEVSAWIKRLGEKLHRLRLLVQIPEGYRLKPNAARALHALDPLGLVTYESGLSPTWVAMDNGGKLKPPSFSSWTHSLGAFPLGMVPGLWRKLLASAIEPADVVGSVDGKASKKPAKAQAVQ
jgi:hypothetical protein